MKKFSPELIRAQTEAVLMEKKIASGNAKDYAEAANLINGKEGDNADYNSAEKEAENEPHISIVPRNVLIEKIDTLFEKPNMAIVILLAGDRIFCCDEGVIAELDNKLAGVATIAPKGEEMSGQPTIVSLYVVPEYRGKGIGAKILRETVERCIERGFENIRMDVMSSNAMQIIDKLPEDLKKTLDVRNLGKIMDNF